MLRYLLVASLCLVANGRLLAAEPLVNAAAPPAAINSSAAPAGTTPAILPPASDAKPAQSPSGRKEIEAQLQAPAKLDFGQRSTVTIKELLDQLHEQHQLSIRFDIPTLSGMWGPEALVSSSISSSSSASNNTKSKRESTTEAKGEPYVAPNEEIGAKHDAKAEPANSSEHPQLALGGLLDLGVDLHNIDLKNVSVATILRHALDAIPANNMEGEFGGMPIVPTNAWLLDYIVEDDGLLITPRLNALTLKETRVYSLKQLKDINPEELAKVIRHSVRPWSWRSQINDLGDQLRVGTSALPGKTLATIVKTGFQMASEETGITLEPTPGDAVAEIKNAPNSDAKDSDAAAAAALGNAAVNVLVTGAHAGISALEMMHFAELPTGTIQTLPGKLIITQSQAAHREIADLLKQLDEE